MHGPSRGTSESVRPQSNPKQMLFTSQKKMGLKHSKGTRLKCHRSASRHRPNTPPEIVLSNRTYLLRKFHVSHIPILESDLFPRPLWERKSTHSKCVRLNCMFKCLGQGHTCIRRATRLYLQLCTNRRQFETNHGLLFNRSRRVCPEHERQPYGPA